MSKILFQRLLFSSIQKTFLFIFVSLAFSALAYSESLWTETKDGRKIHIFFLKGKGDTSKARYPIVLVHGMGAQGKYWYFDQNISWAYMFADEGFDVFIPDLRGVGSSGGDMDFNFEDYIYDVIAITDKVCSIEGVDKIHWVAHSMGGMLIYLAASRAPEVTKKLASFVAISSPFRIWNPFDIWWKFLKIHFDDISMFLKKVDRIPFSTFTHIFWFFSPIVDWRWGWLFSFEHLVWNPENVDKKTRRNALLATGDISSRVLEKFFRVGLGLESFGFNLKKLDVPSLFVAGVKDYLAPPPTVRIAYINSGSRNKSFVLAGISEGFKADYGHVDINISAISREDIFRVILGFILSVERDEFQEGVAEGEYSDSGKGTENITEEEMEDEKTAFSRKISSFQKKEYRESKYSFLLIQDFGFHKDIWNDFSEVLDKKRMSYIMPDVVLSPSDIKEIVDYFCSSFSSTFNIGIFHGISGLVASKLKENCFSMIFLIGVPLTEISTFYSLYLQQGGNISRNTKLSLFLSHDDKFDLKLFNFTPLELENLFFSPFNFKKGQLVFYILSTGDRATWWWNIADFPPISDTYEIRSKYLILSYANMQKDLSHAGLIFGESARKYVIPFIMEQIKNLKKIM